MQIELSPNDIKHLTEVKKDVLEEIFILVYKTSMTFEDAQNLPVSKRKWFVRRVMKQLEAERPPESNVPPPPRIIPK